MRQLLVRCCGLGVLVAALSPAASQEDFGTPPPARLPRQVYQRVVIPDDNPPPQQTQAQAPPRQEDGGREAACTGLGCPPTELDKANELLATGPDTAEIYVAPLENVAHQFAAVGFVREGWPLSIEYQAEPGTVTVLRIKLYHHRKILIFPIPFFEVAFQANLDALPAESEGADPWHRTVMVPEIALSREADPIAGPGLHVARYEIRSYRLVDGEIDKRQRVPVRVLGITVGPEAVGSLTLRGAAFDSGTRQLPAAGQPPLRLRFAYRTDKTYDLLRESIDLYNDDELAYRLHQRIGTPRSAGPAQTFNAVWETTRQQQPGTYRAVVSGWWNCRGRTMSDMLASCPDNPNWAVATSADIVLTR